MEAAQLLLEYIKVLVWPIVVLILALKFRSGLAAILAQLGSRLGTAASVKVGVLGQEFEISGTAQELIRKREELLAEQPGSGEAQEAAQRIGKSIQQLNKPMADIVGTALLRTGRRGASLEEIVREVLKTFSAGKPIQHPPFLIITMSDQVEKVLDELGSLGLVVLHEERYALTEEGKDLYARILAKQESLIKRFAMVSNA